MNRQIIHNYQDIYRNGLFEDILPFWLNHAIDWEDGGFTFCLNRDGSILDTDKGVWQTARFSWMILTLYNEVERRDEWNGCTYDWSGYRPGIASESGG